MKSVFDSEFKEKFVEKKIIGAESELTHLISDAATMKLVVWTDGGFGMAAHNYDGDVLTDELAQVHMSRDSSQDLVGVDKTAPSSHTHTCVARHGDGHGRGEAPRRGDPSLNPLGMVEGLIGAMNHAADVHGCAVRRRSLSRATVRTRHSQALPGGTGHPRLCGAGGLTTEQFIDAVAEEIAK